MLDETTSPCMMVTARARSAFKALAVFVRKSFAQPAQSRIADRRDFLRDKLPVACLFRAKISRTGQQIRNLVLHERTHIPILRVETILVMMRKLTSELDE